MNPFIDYSQFKDFSICEWKWYEKVVRQTQRTPREGQREDALTLGSLVHEGLHYFRMNGVIEIPENTLNTYNPTPECVQWARALLIGYVKAYPDEGFTKYFCEQPLRFKLIEGFDGLAKLDTYFHINQPYQLSDGLGDHFTLEPGWWIKEYKTKDASRKLDNYIDSWRVNMQACFQMLALQEHLGEQVNGCLVDVLEKPKEYIPERTCKQCKGKYELRNWIPTGGGYACPMCTHVQELKSYEPKSDKKGPVYYRLRVQRSENELAQALREIREKAQRMQCLMQDGVLPHRETERCVDSIWGRCEYFEPHTALKDAEGWGGFVQIDPFSYIKEDQEGISV